VWRRKRVSVRRRESEERERRVEMEVVVDEPNKSLELKCSKPREGGSAVGSLTNGLRSTRRIFLSPTVLSFPIVPFVGVCFSANRGKTSKVVFVQFEVHRVKIKNRGP